MLSEKRSHAQNAPSGANEVFLGRATKQQFCETNPDLMGSLAPARNGSAFRAFG